MPAVPERVAFTDLDDLIEGLVERVLGASIRIVLGITGPPGAGKSTTANRVVDAACARAGACVAPMDGFHRSDAELADLGLLALKGVPDSFDATGFLDKLADVRTGEDVVWPTFDRRREVVVPDGRLIDAATRLVVVEGNYLLLDASPWDRVRGHLDTVWYLDVPEDVLIPRLRVRHERRRTPEDAWAKVRSTDLPNAALVADTRSRADVIIAMR